MDSNEKECFAFSEDRMVPSSRVVIGLGMANRQKP